MNRFKYYMLTAAGLIALVLTAAFIGSSSAGAFQTNDVRVINTKSEPVPTDDLSDANRHITQAVKTVVQNIGTNASAVDLLSVPEGKRLVIEQVSAVGQVPPGQIVSLFQLITVVGGAGGISHDLLVNTQPPFVNGDALFRASQQVRLYADPGTRVQAIFVRNSGGGKGTFQITISGYFVDVP